MRQRLTAAISATTLLVLTLTACMEDDDPDPAALVIPPSSLAQVTDDSAATTAISQSLDELRSGNSGTFSTHLKYADNIYDFYGSYRLIPAAQRVSVTADLPDGPVMTEAVGDARHFYVRLPPDGPVSSPCWVSGDPALITELIGVETSRDFNQYPGAVILASTAIGIAYVEGSVTHEVLGSVDLATAMALISPRLPALLGIVGANDRVLARFTLTDGALTSIKVDGPAILAALEESGTEADPQELADVFAADTPIEVTLADSGADVVIEPPDPSAVIDLAAPDAQARVDACE
jgi:hypothetical protein